MKTMKKVLSVFLSAMIVIACCITAIATTPSYTTATDFYTMSNWVGPSASNCSADGSTYIEMGYLRLAERSFAMTLKKNTIYTLSFKVTANWGVNGKGKLYIGDTLKVYQTDDTTKTDIVTSKTGHDAWLAFDGSTVVTLQFTTGTVTGYTLYFKGNWQADNAALGGKFTNFAFTETPVAPTYSTVEDFYKAETWTQSGKKPTVSADQVSIAAPAYQNMVATLTLKPNTTYQFSVDYAPTYHKTKLYSGGYGFSVFEEGKGVADTLCTSESHGTNGAAGSIQATFTTTDATEYCFRIGFDACQCPDHTKEPHYQSNYNFTNFALTEKQPAPATPVCKTAADLQVATNWTPAEHVTCNQITDGVQISAWHTVWAGMFTTLELKANTTYTITADFVTDCFTNIVSDANGIVVIPTSKYTVETAKTADWPSKLAPETIGSGYTHNGKTSGTMTVTFTTTDETQYVLGIRDNGRGSVVTWDCSPTVNLTNFGIAEKQPEPAGPTYTTATDFYTVANWEGPKEGENAGADGATYIDMNYLSWQTRSFAMNLKPNTNYKLSYTVTGGWGTDGQQYLSFSTIKVYHTADAEKTDIAQNKVDVDASVKYNEKANISMEFKTDDTGKATLCMICPGLTPQAMGGKFTNFVLEEFLPAAPEEFSAPTWTIYYHNKTFGSEQASGLTVTTSNKKDANGDGKSLAVSANCAVPTTKFSVEKNKIYRLTYQYYADSGLTTFPSASAGCIMTDTWISTGSDDVVFKDGHIAGNLAGIGMNYSFTTEGGDPDTAVKDEQTKITKEPSALTGRWHTVSLVFNSGNFEELYLVIRMGWNTPTMYLDDITLAEYKDPAKGSSWTAYDGDAANLNAAPSTTLTVGDTTAAEHVKYGSSSIELNTAGGHAAVPIEVEPNTAYYLYYYYKSDTANSVAASTVLAPGGVFASPLGTADLGKGTAGKWSKALIEFNSGNNTVVYLNVDAKNGAYPVYINGIKVLPDVDANTAMKTAEQWIAYGGEGINGALADSWAVIFDSYSPDYDHDGDGHSIKISAPNCYATVPLRHLQQDTWYRLTYWYYSPTQITDSGRDLVLDNTRVSKEDAKFEFGASEGVLVGQNFTTNFTTKNGDLATAISYIGGGTGEPTGTKQYAGNWHRVEMFFNSYDNETLYLSAKPAALKAGKIMTVYIDDCKLELAKPYLLTDETDTLYCEQMYNGIPNASFESATSNKDWGETLPTGMTIKTGDNLPHGTKYLNVSGKQVYELRLKGMALYTLAASLRGTGLVGITSDHEGLNFLLNEEGTAKSALTANGATEWERKAFTFRASDTGLLYLVFDSNSSLDVDYIQLFEKEFGKTEDIDNYIPIEDFDFDNIDPSIIVLNGGVDEDYVPPVLGGEPSPETGEPVAVLLVMATLLLSAVAALFVSKQKKGGEA